MEFGASLELFINKTEFFKAVHHSDEVNENWKFPNVKAFGDEIWKKMFYPYSISQHNIIEINYFQWSLEFLIQYFHL